MPKQNINSTECNKSGNKSRFLGHYAFRLVKILTDV